MYIFASLLSYEISFINQLLQSKSFNELVLFSINLFCLLKSFEFVYIDSKHMTSNVKTYDYMCDITHKYVQTCVMFFTYACKQFIPFAGIT